MEKRLTRANVRQMAKDTLLMLLSLLGLDVQRSSR
jgi:hypothetical protein